MINKIYEVKNETQSILADTRADWESRYAQYASNIINKSEQLRKCKSQFNQCPPLYLYSTIGKPNHFQLRYKGQTVAGITIEKNGLLLKRTEKEIASTTKYFDYPPQWRTTPWRGKEATAFRKHFQKLDKKFEPRQLEHKYECMMLTEMEKQDKSSKFLGTYHGIQPVKIADISRFQLRTPISASKKGKTYSNNAQGGGIDILARIGRGSANLSIFELKRPEVETVQETIEQGLAYTVFLRELLRSTSGPEWYQIFGYTSPIPQKLTLNCIALMHHHTPKPNFSHEILNLENDEIHLHHMFYEVRPNGLTIEDTSLTT